MLSGEGVARAGQDLELPPTARDGDVSVAGYVGARLGGEVVDRLVDPLLGGVYAGRSAELSFDATLPALAAASRRHRSLAEAARSLLPPQAQAPRGTRAGGPVFTTLTGGLGVLPAYLAKASGAEVRTGAMARELARPATAGGSPWARRRRPEQLDADAVILAIPARPASRLLAGVPGAAAAVTAFGQIGYASMAIVTLAYPRSAFPGPGLAASGWSGTWCPPWTGGPSRRSPSPRSSGRTWPDGRPAPGRWRSCAARSAASARRRCCSAPTTSWPRWPRPNWRRRPGCGADPWPPG